MRRVQPWDLTVRIESNEHRPTASVDGAFGVPVSENREAGVSIDNGDLRQVGERRLVLEQAGHRIFEEVHTEASGPARTAPSPPLLSPPSLPHRPRSPLPSSTLSKTPHSPHEETVIITRTSVPEREKRRGEEGGKWGSNPTRARFYVRTTLLTTPWAANSSTLYWH
eukprot:scaffold279657_cov30-Tisochrysis_lutea.AAC.6